MSEVRLNIIDRERAISDTVHGYFGDASVAALTAEPETVRELGLALARFIRPQGDSSPFERFRRGVDLEAYDAGVMVIDLAGRVVAVESGYSLPSAGGSFRVQSDFANEDFDVPYRLSDEWLFVYSIPEYEGVCRQRREERERLGPLDARTVLYGEPLLGLIAEECLAAGVVQSGKSGADDDKLFGRIHARWLMTARADLRGWSPREVLLEKREFVDFDLQGRELQWAFTKEVPPPLPLNSRAYRYAGFGTHEIVVYYGLVRHLLGACFECVKATESRSVAAAIESLAELKSRWLESSDGECGGRTRAQIIECERRRLPLVMSAHDALIDEDCRMCVGLSEDFDTPGFWHLDGSGVDEGFAFSFHRTEEEYEAEEREREEFHRRFERDCTAGKNRQSFDDVLIDLEDDDVRF